MKKKFCSTNFCGYEKIGAPKMNATQVNVALLLGYSFDIFDIAPFTLFTDKALRAMVDLTFKK